MCADDHARARCRSLLALAAVIALGGSGCLPDDTRPTPGQVQVQVVSAPDSFATDDGWEVTFSAVLMGIGALELEGSDCVHYNQTRYTRLFEVTTPDANAQPVGLAYGIGDCDLGFDVRTPESNSLLGEGATADDITAMRAEVDDAWVSEPEPTSVHVRGEATRQGQRKRFDWRFRKQYEIKQCADGSSGAPGTSMTIDSDQVFQRSLAVDPRSLFRDDHDSETPATFAEMAGADVDGDGAITLDELETVPAPLGAGGAPGAFPEQPSIADRLYDARVPGMVRPAGSGRCEVEVQ